MKFKLEIRLGNEAMENGMDLAMVLKTLAARLHRESDISDGDKGNLRDQNGNTVGEWEITK